MYFNIISTYFINMKFNITYFNVFNPPGSLMWFHARTLAARRWGEGLAVQIIGQNCAERRPAIGIRLILSGSKEKNSVLHTLYHVARTSTSS
jgi:hypothetical protein